MGPTNVALVKLFDADQKYRQAKARYDAVSKDVRLQERRLTELVAKLAGTNAQLKDSQASLPSIGNLEIHHKIRDLKDNNPYNLQVLTHEEHQDLHRSSV